MDSIRFNKLNKSSNNNKYIMILVKNNNNQMKIKQKYNNKTLYI